MKIISNRGNLSGKNSCVENHPLSVEAALEKGYMVNVDCWVIADLPKFGNTSPMYDVHPNFLKNDKLIFRAKNIEAMQYLMKNRYHCYWNEHDKYCLTSRGLLICSTGMPAIKHSESVALTPERCANSLEWFEYIITDNPMQYAVYRG